MNISNLNKAAILLGRMGDKNSPTQPIVPHKNEKPLLPALNNASVTRCTPEEVGISSAELIALLDKLNRDKSLNMHSIIMSRNGKVFCEATFGTHSLNLHKATFSLCKSIVSLGIGIAMDEGLISHDTRVIDIFADLCNPIIRLKLKELTVYHLLTMQSGITFNEFECMTDKDWVRSFLRSSAEDLGKKFNYNSLNTYMLAAILNRVTGMKFKEYMDKKLFVPLDIVNYHWETCPSGIEKGGWGLYLSPYDTLKLGILVQNGGRYEDKQIVSEQYITAATSFKVKTPATCGAFDYGYQTWVGRDGKTFLFNGMFGQNCLGFKENGLLIISNAGCDELFQTSGYYSAVLEFFGREFPSQLAPDNRAYRKLLRFIGSLKFAPERPTIIDRLLRRNNPYSKLKALEGKISESFGANSVGLLPIVLQAVHNNYSSGLKGIAFKKENDGYYMIYNEFSAEHKVPIDPLNETKAVLTFHGDSYLTSITCRFAENEYGETVLLIDIHFAETPCTRHIKLVFLNDGFRLYQSETPGEKTISLIMDMVRETLKGKPILSSLMGKVDGDYLLYKAHTIFEPDITLSFKK